MGAGSSASKTRVLAKIQVVSAISAKSNTSTDEQRTANSDEQTRADDFVKRRSIHGYNRRLLYNDTSSAWKVLSENMNHAVLSKKVSRQSSNPSSKISNASSQDEGDIEEVTEQHIYRAVRKITRDEDCSLCGAAGSYNGECHGCRICNKLYHHLCLEQHGNIHDELNTKALGESETEIGWSCPECENIFDLLTESEKTQIIELFDKMVGNDTSIDFQNYIHQKKKSYTKLVGIEMTSQRENQEVGYFYDLDRDGSGSLEWWEFAPAMSIKFLSRRSQSELLALLTDREISKLEFFFRLYDEDDEGTLTFSQAKYAYLKWFLSLIKRDDENSIPVAWTGELPPGWFGELDNDRIGKQVEAEITWQKFLSMNALHVISARPNTVETRPYAPAVNDAICVKVEDDDVGLKMVSTRPQIDEDDTELIDPFERIKMRLKNK